MNTLLIAWITCWKNKTILLVIKNVWTHMWHQWNAYLSNHVQWNRQPSRFLTKRANNMEQVLLQFHYNDTERIFWIIDHAEKNTQKNNYQTIWNNDSKIQSSQGLLWHGPLQDNIVYNTYNKGKSWIILWTHKRHPIPCHNGQGMGCILWVFYRQLAMLQEDLIIFCPTDPLTTWCLTLGNYQVYQPHYQPICDTTHYS